MLHDRDENCVDNATLPKQSIESNGTSNHGVQQQFRESVLTDNVIYEISSANQNAIRVVPADRSRAPGCWFGFSHAGHPVKVSPSSSI